MKFLFNAILIAVVLSINLFSQYEFKDQPVSFPKFSNNQFKLTKQQNFINVETLDSIINSTMNQYHIPGLTALAVKYDSIIWSNNYGYANIALNRTVNDSTLFMMASISKTVIVTAMMQLWENGLFDLEDNINDYLQPDLQVFNPYHPNDTITIKMIMTHTSSIRDNWPILLPIISCGDSPIQLDTFMINYYTPGSIYYSLSNFYTHSPNANNYQYTNAGTGILAYLVEKLSGMPFNQYCRENIFDPLGMNKTSWFLEGLNTTNIATPYQWISNQYVANCQQGWPLYPVAFLRTNKIELLSFLSAYMNFGNSILDSSTISLMFSDHLGYINQYGEKQGLIWYATPYDGEWLWGHTGAWAYGTNTAMFFHPEQDWGIIFFMNIYTTEQAFLTILQAICDYASEWQVPVELTSFTASSNGEEVTLNWSTATELNNQGFEIERSEDNVSFNKIGFVPGFGTTTEPKSYNYSDQPASSGTFYYRLKQVDYDGSFEYSEVVEVEWRAFNSYLLEQNYPNPFNPTTTIRFGLQNKSIVKIIILNAIGEEVAVVLNEEKEAGFHQVRV